MPFRKLFLSRWSALLWAGGIVWTAVDVAGVSPAPAPTTNAATEHQADATGVAVSDDDLATLANIMKGD